MMIGTALLEPSRILAFYEGAEAREYFDKTKMLWHYEIGHVMYLRFW
jgi:hypothetical protein